MAKFRRTGWGIRERYDEYEHVYEILNDDNTISYAFKLYRKYKTINSIKYDTAREAAIAVDKLLINLGEEPVNILKKK